MDHRPLIKKLEDNIMFAGDYSYLIYDAACALRQQQEENDALRAQIDALQHECHSLSKLLAYNPIKEV